MAAEVTVSSVKAYVRLINGQTAQGSTKYLNLSLGAMNKDAFDDDKALAITTLLEPCLAKSVGGLQKSVVSNIESDD